MANKYWSLKLQMEKTPFSEQLLMTYLYLEKYLHYSECNFVPAVIVQGPEICQWDCHICSEWQDLLKGSPFVAYNCVSSAVIMWLKDSDC